MRAALNPKLAPQTPPPKRKKYGLVPTRPQDLGRQRSTNPDKPLTEKQRAFVKLWASGESVTTASIRAGYIKSSEGYDLIKKPNVLQLYETEKKAYEDSIGMTRARVMEGLLDSAQMAKLMAEPASMVAAWREIGKMCGYYEPVTRKVEVSVNGGVALKQLQGMSDEDLLKMIATPAALIPEEETEDGD